MAHLYHPSPFEMMKAQDLYEFREATLVAAIGALSDPVHSFAFLWCEMLMLVPDLKFSVLMHTHVHLVMLIVVVGRNAITAEGFCICVPATFCVPPEYVPSD
jgi:hypothetical protein